MEILWFLAGSAVLNQTPHPSGVREGDAHIFVVLKIKRQL